ncbi:adenosine deaminase family protein [Legionella sp. CNM-4043-24]|uniref:adenosine deaminase family protein n=1 Tax=Legionella sp. CNM-4043-24 TaxID=3421646 RepID=UPI00403A89C2
MRLLALSCILFSTLPSLAAASVNERFEQVKSDPNALYAFLKNMPKGGELHYHLSGGAYPETMLAVAAKGNYCLNQDTFVMSPILQTCEGIEARDLSQNPELYNQTIRAWSMKDFIPGRQSSHDHFFASFYLFGKLVAAEHVPLLAEVMQRAVDQNEQYMEIMIMPDNAKSGSIVSIPVLPADFTELKSRLLADPAFAAEIDNTVKVADSLLTDTQKYLACDKTLEQDVCRLTVRFQYHVLRNQPLEKVFPQALHAFAAASRSKAIVGVNLVQAEDGFISLRDYRQQMQIFEFMHQAYPDVRISLHAGELSSGDVLPEDLRFHIHDAIKTGHAERIGHGLDIGFEDNAENILADMARNSIPVEINLVSNQKIFGISGRKHPLSYYLSRNVPVVLSTDDEGILRTDLTHQYVEAVQQHGVDYPALRQINRNALTYSFLPGKSLWRDAALAIPVPECMDLNSSSCDQFIKESEKAGLQRQLELKLAEFEQAW